MDDGAGGSFSEVNATYVNNNPSLRSYTINFNTTDTAKTFRFYMLAKNVIGSV